jgi:hypothetical protein
MDHLSMKAKFNANILCHVFKVVTCKIKCCRIVFALSNTHNTSWSAPHSHMPPPNSPILGTNIKNIRAWWITLLITKDGAYSLTFAKVTNPNIIKCSNQITMYYSPTKLKQLYRRWRAKNMCMVKEANRISFIYLTIECGIPRCRPAIPEMPSPRRPT